MIGIYKKRAEKPFFLKKERELPLFHYALGCALE